MLQKSFFFARFKTTKCVINMNVWWSDNKCVKVTTRIVLSTILIELIMNFSNILMDGEYMPEYTLCMSKQYPRDEQDPHHTVAWVFWDAIVIFFAILIICVIIWDLRSYQLVKGWVDAQDRYILHDLNADELHLKNEPQMKSTIINALMLCFHGIYAAIPSRLFEALTFNDVSLIYQTSTIIFLPMILVWNHEAIQQTNGEHEKENRRRLVYDEARARKEEIEAKRLKRTEEQTFERENIERYQVKALKGEFGMYGGVDSVLQDERTRAPLEFHDNGFHNIELKSPDHYLWI